jgi:hypothetical protein
MDDVTLAARGASSRIFAEPHRDQRMNAVAAAPATGVPPK